MVGAGVEEPEPEPGAESVLVVDPELRFESVLVVEFDIAEDADVEFVSEVEAALELEPADVAAEALEEAAADSLETTFGLFLPSQQL